MNAMILSPIEKRALILKAINHESDLKAALVAERKHKERIERQDNQIEKTKENRKQLMLEHEANNRANRAARQQDVIARQEFIKKSLNVL